jgi:anti-sigma regulatory factor (Ser/Thr protein kinase)
MRHLAFGYSRPMSSPDRVSRQPAAAPAPRAVDVDQPFDADGLYALRATLAAHTSRHGASEEQIQHLIIVASELATNAIRHGGGTGRLRVWHDETAFYCEVTDQGSGMTDPSLGTTPPDPTSPDGGRGIWIVRNLTSDLRIGAGPDGRGTTVTAAIPLDGP